MCLLLTTSKQKDLMSYIPYLCLNDFAYGTLSSNQIMIYVAGLSQMVIFRGHVKHFQDFTRKSYTFTHHSSGNISTPTYT